MNKFNDTLKTTYESAAKISHGLAEFGDGSMGEGIRRLAKGKYLEGMKDGVIVITFASGLFALGTWGIKKVVAHHKSKIKNTKVYIDPKTGEAFSIEINKYKGIELKNRLTKNKKKIDEFFATYSNGWTEEEGEELMIYLTENLEILKEMSKLQYQRIYANVA